MTKNGPNKTVAKAAKKRAFDPEKQAEKDTARAERLAGDDFMQWVFAQAGAGKSFATIDEARIAFDAA